MGDLDARPEDQRNTHTPGTGLASGGSLVEGPGPSPASILRRSLLAWGLGEIALGNLASGSAWLLGEAAAAALVAYLVIGLAATSWYLVPFLAGIGFIGMWAFQAIRSYRRARTGLTGVAPAPARSPAAGVAWLGLPLLVWGASFWLFSGAAANPASVVDRFESSWPGLATGRPLDPALGAPTQVVDEARAALGTLQRLCGSGSLTTDCADAPANLLRDVRFTVDTVGPDVATVSADLVRFERHASHFLWLFPTSDLVAVVQQRILLLDLRAAPTTLPGGLEVAAQRWRIVNARSD